MGKKKGKFEKWLLNLYKIGLQFKITFNRLKSFWKSFSKRNILNVRKKPCTRQKKKNEWRIIDAYKLKNLHSNLKQSNWKEVQDFLLPELICVSFLHHFNNVWVKMHWVSGWKQIQQHFTPIRVHCDFFQWFQNFLQ